MKHTKPKKHHYVPQFLLRNFCAGDNKKIYVFDKKKINVFSSSTKNIAHENNFYNDDGMGYQESTELKLGGIENQCAPIIERIINEESLININKLEQAMICLFVTVQLTRTKSTRDFLSGMNKQIAEWMQMSGFDPNLDVDGFIDQSPQEIKESSINILRTIPGDLAKYLFDKEWALLKSPKNESFYLSDHPITMHNYYPRLGRGNHGLSLKGIEVHFPITPSLCITFMCSRMIGEFRDKVKEQKRRAAQGTSFPVDLSLVETILNHIDSNRIRILQPENIEFHNSLQVNQSTRFLYSNNEEFKLAKDMLKVCRN